MKSGSHRGQHFIPRSYLSAWTDPACPSGQTPYVWRFPREGGDGRRKSPENIFKETDIYTIRMPDGSRNLTLEQGLQQLEQGINVLRREFINVRKPLPTIRHLKLMAFLSAMKHRTPAFRNHHREQWGNVIRKGEEMEARYQAMTPEQRDRFARAQIPSNNPTMSMDDVKKIAEMPIQLFLPARLELDVPILSQMQSVILMAPKDHPFITSDNPAVQFDPDMGKRPLQYRNADLAYRSIQVSMPLSPSAMLYIIHEERPTRGRKSTIYMDIPPETVDAFNYRTAWNAHEYLINNRNEMNARWFFPQAESTGTT